MICVYGIKNCDKIKKTLTWLQQHRLEHRLHDYRKDGINPELIQELLAKFSLTELINRRGTTWRNLPESSKESLDASSAAALMQENPAVIKRPIITDGQRWLIGYDEDAFNQLID